LFVPSGRLSWLSVSFLLHVKYTVSYRIVSYKNKQPIAFGCCGHVTPENPWLARMTCVVVCCYGANYFV